MPEPRTITLKHADHGEVVVDLDQYLGKTGHGDWHEGTHGAEQGWEPTEPLPEDDEPVMIEGETELVEDPAASNAPKGKPKGRGKAKA